MKAKLIRTLRYGPNAERPGEEAPPGTIIDHPDAWKLVRLGDAVCEDDECRHQANMTPEQLVQVQHARERLAQGIHPDDYRAYDEGLMTGYYPDGTWIPGPAADVDIEDEEEIEDG